MTISVHSFLALLLITGTMSCTRQSNSISNLKLECGDEGDAWQSYEKRAEDFSSALFHRGP